MTWSRREVLTSLGVASANAILFACGGSAARRTKRPTAVNPELHTWLREAVAILHGAGLADPHALAVSRKRATAALDVLGAAVGRNRYDGLVLSVRAKDGSTREQATNDLSREGILETARLLAGGAKATTSLDFGPVPRLPSLPDPDPDTLEDAPLLARVGALAGRDRTQSSRIVYAAAVIDIDDAHVWSVRPGSTLAQRLVRVQRSVTRVAWHGTRPIVSEAARAWIGGVDAQDLSDDEIRAARENALGLPSPDPFKDQPHDVVLDPAVAASVLDAAVRGLLTADAQRRPEVAKRFGAGARSVAPAITLVDDPTVPGAYGGFQFDDRGQPAVARTLIDGGQVVGRIDRERRAGHVGRSETAPSNLRLVAGTVELDQLLVDGMYLEGPLNTLVDPASDRLVIQIARAREWLKGRRTGRVFADVELVGELGALLTSVSAVSNKTQAIGIRDELDGQPRWRSVETPWLRGRAALRQRRRLA